MVLVVCICFEISSEQVSKSTLDEIAFRLSYLINSSRKIFKHIRDRYQTAVSLYCMSKDKSIFIRSYAFQSMLIHSKQNLFSKVVLIVMVFSVFNMCAAWICTSVNYILLRSRLKVSYYQKIFSCFRFFQKTNKTLLP